MNIYRLCEGFWNLAIRRLVRCPEDIPMFLSEGKILKGNLFVPVKTFQLWCDEKPLTKFIALLKLNWRPSDESLQVVAREVLYREVFGDRSDLAPWLLELTHWHKSQIWPEFDLSEADTTRAGALEALTVLTQRRLGEGSDQALLNLKLAEKVPQLMLLPFIMCVKVPITSFHRFLNIDARFVFGSIRSADHPKADLLILYIYELLFLQQKIATSLHEYARLATFITSRKNDALLLNAEIDGIMNADLIFSYLKASLEKTMVLTGLIFNVSNIDSKKNHAGRCKAILEAIPKEIHEIPYCGFLLEFMKAENLEDLNNYRSGLLHKKGIADLQPHNYVGRTAVKLPFNKIFLVLHEQHSKNTAMLISALALLTDRLAELDPPKMSPHVIERELSETIKSVVLYLDNITSAVNLEEMA